MCVFGDFNVYHKDWLTYSCEVIHRVNSVIIFYLQQPYYLVNFPSRIPEFDSRIPALLALFLSSDASISSTMLFHPSENFDHVVVSGSIDFAGTLLRTLIFDDSDISLPIFPFGANLRLHDISVTPNMVGRTITKLDLSKASCPNCIGGFKEL